MEDLKKNIYLCVFGDLLFVKCAPSTLHLKSTVVEGYAKVELLSGIPKGYHFE